MSRVVPAEAIVFNFHVCAMMQESAARLHVADTLLCTNYVGRMFLLVSSAHTLEI